MRITLVVGAWLGLNSCDLEYNDIPEEFFLDATIIETLQLNQDLSIEVYAQQDDFLQGYNYLMYKVYDHRGQTYLNNANVVLNTSFEVQGDQGMANDAIIRNMMLQEPNNQLVMMDEVIFTHPSASNLSWVFKASLLSPDHSEVIKSEKIINVNPFSNEETNMVQFQESGKTQDHILALKRTEIGQGMNDISLYVLKNAFGMYTKPEDYQVIVQPFTLDQGIRTYAQPVTMMFDAEIGKRFYEGMINLPTADLWYLDIQVRNNNDEVIYQTPSAENIGENDAITIRVE